MYPSRDFRVRRLSPIFSKVSRAERETMSMQTAWMLAGESEDQRRVSYVEYGDGFAGELWINHPPPSGLERWMLLISDNRRFKTEPEAREAWEADIVPALESMVSSVS